MLLADFAAVALSVSLCSTAPPHAGEPRARPWTEANFVVRRTFLRLRLATDFAAIDAGALGSPSGRAGAKRLRGEPPKLHKYTKFPPPLPKIPSRACGAKRAGKIGNKEKKAKTQK